MIIKRPFTRVVVIADLHCGHRVGLTPPAWQSDAPGGKYLLIQQQLWDVYASYIDAVKPIDYLFLNGDSIDGKGERSGGTELITTDRTKQINMAYDCVMYAGCKNIVSTIGTPYHVGEAEDWEVLLGEELGTIATKSHEWPRIDGITFDLKHQSSGSSQIPHGRATPLGREKLWNMIWAEYDAQPRSDIIIRSHVHFAVSFTEPHWIGMFTPALQGAGTKYGARRCSGLVHFGITVIDLYPGENLQERVRWHWKTTFVQSQRSEVLELCEPRMTTTAPEINGAPVADDGYQQPDSSFWEDQIVTV